MQFEGFCGECGSENGAFGGVFAPQAAAYSSFTG